MVFENFLFIGPLEYGSTSKMRHDIFKEILNIEIDIINTSNIIYSKHRILRSIGWRFKIGPLISSINEYIDHEIFTKNKIYDIVWIEKGVFIKPEIIRELKLKSKKLVHYTPDPAFYYHRSHLFYRSLPYYDFFITTKSFEIELYRKKTNKPVVYCTQGYDERIHRPYFSFDEKKYDVCFIGHHEIQREKIIQSILNLGITVSLAGIKWEKFVNKNKNNKYLYYFGSNVAGEDYAKLISLSKIGLGLLSKWIPEKHTTRTFEIPACGSALLTERNSETENFFNDSEVIFFENDKEIPLLIKKYLTNKNCLESLVINGSKKVLNNGYSYSEILKNILEQL
jgi:spore maturation protein CgeB